MNIYDDEEERRQEQEELDLFAAKYDKDHPYYEYVHPEEAEKERLAERRTYRFRYSHKSYTADWIITCIGLLAVGYFIYWLMSPHTHNTAVPQTEKTDTITTTTTKTSEAIQTPNDTTAAIEETTSAPVTSKQETELERLLKHPDYDKGYDDGYEHGLEDGEAGEPSELRMERRHPSKAYEYGYEDGYEEGYIDGFDRFDHPEYNEAELDEMEDDF